MGWIDDVDARFGQKRRDEETRRRSREVLDAKASAFFDAVRREAALAVRRLKAAPPVDLQDVSYHENKVYHFEVKNPVYPAVCVDAEPTAGGIRFITKTVRSASSPDEVKEDRIDFSLDANDALVLSFCGRRLAGIDDVLRLMLDPVFAAR